MPKNKSQNQVEDSPAKTFSLISNEKLLAIYAAMLKCRLLEQRAADFFQRVKLGSDLHLSAGREATAASAVIDLQQEDSLCLGQGDWLPALVKGMSLENLFRVLAPTALQKDEAVHLEAERKNIIIPSPKVDLTRGVVEHASTAMTARTGAVTVSFISSAADSLPQWRKSIQAEGAKKLPIF